MLKAAYLQAGQGWIDAFNAGDSVTAASFYEADAIINVRSVLDFGGIPVAGVRVGTAEIEAFWSVAINTFGLDDVRYIQPEFIFVDDNTVFVSANFTMNGVGGFIHSEVWILQDDGSMKLRYDEFSIRYFR